MPYKIKHQSQNECLIQYVEDRHSRRKPSVSLTMIIAAVMALIIGIDFLVIFSAIVIIAFLRNVTNPPRRGFSIELNRQKNHITVKNTGQANPRSTVLPLEHFLGFGLQETQTPKKAKKQPYANLFFKFDEGVLASPLAKKSEVLELAKRAADGYGGYFWPIPVRSIAHPAPAANAKKIIAATDDWLMNADQYSSVEADFEINVPEEDPEIIRDFRELE